MAYLHNQCGKIQTVLWKFHQACMFSNLTVSPVNCIGYYTFTVLKSFIFHMLVANMFSLPYYWYIFFKNIQTIIQCILAILIDGLPKNVTAIDNGHHYRIINRLSKYANCLSVIWMDAWTFSIQILSFHEQWFYVLRSSCSVRYIAIRHIHIQFSLP